MVSLSNYESIDNSSSKLLAWCSKGSNRIKVVNLNEQKEEYANFEGVKLRNRGTNRHFEL